MQPVEFVHIAPDAALPETLRGAVVAIGNFDGVHRGHQAVLECALEEAKARGVPAVVLSFTPHPRQVFRPEMPLFQLTPSHLKARLLQALGFSGLVELRFSREFATQSAQSFIDNILLGKLGVVHVVTGFDFHFGRNREGTPDFLKTAGEGAGFGVTMVEAFSDEGGERVSSSRVREFLCTGEISQAAGLLGYRFIVEAPVQHGQKLGRTLGYPTANMTLPDDATLAHGIYAVRLRRADGSLHDGVASFGRRPTVTSHGEPLLETFVFDFSGDLYGEVCSVSFFAYLRGEVKFDGLDPLVEQMRRDEVEARAVLAAAQPIGPLDHRLNFSG
ncbi:riboflavin biosynthesis protein [Limoniibacter endophyticus]|uniref:Riboflavin biosynthesis protein n=1 Tax=Limoniibacter endophyticus TaxID=1565040 RepID=A0A8J3GGV1_9HYPH|nr:bifunctional riboflavin kinase/FAD synthetase [Limoniibacter endophyticus]GHC67853.1 riboflavin biosynthesis protein [Limoniibacter endophyticus]